MAIATAATLILPKENASTAFQWVNGAVVTATDTTAAMVGIASIAQATLYLKVTAASGTSPTFDLFLQKLLPDAATWQDIAHFAQATGTGNQVMHMVTGGNKVEAQQTNSLAAATINAVPFGSTWRLSALIAGTSPSFTFSVWMEGQS